MASRSRKYRFSAERSSGDPHAAQQAVVEDTERRVPIDPWYRPGGGHRGPALGAGTALPGVSLAGVHLRLPGAPEEGPTLEIFEYSDFVESEWSPVNRPGYGHIGFAVASVDDARSEVLANGRSAVGEVVSLTASTGEAVRSCYVRDPEGNIVELQSWS